MSVPLFSPLSSGDTVGIYREKNPQIELEWLDFIKSPEARKNIEIWVEKQKREEAEKLGEKILQKKLGWIQESIESPIFVKYVDEKNIKYREIFEQIGKRKLNENEFLAKFLEEKKGIFPKNIKSIISSEKIYYSGVFTINKKNKTDEYLQFFSQHNIIVLSIHIKQMPTGNIIKGEFYSQTIKDIFCAFEKIEKKIPFFLFPLAYEH